MITASTRRNKTNAVCKDENPNCAVKIGPRRMVNTPRNVPIVKTIPMMLLLKFQRYSHSAARIFCRSAVMPVPEPCMADGRIFAALALAIQAAKRKEAGVDESGGRRKPPMIDEHSVEGRRPGVAR